MIPGNAASETTLACIEVLKAQGLRTRIDAGLILGTGLGPLADEVQDPLIVPYADLPGFPAAGVSGHAGRLVIGRLGLKTVAVLQGRAHYYEHGDARAMRTPIETLMKLGAATMLATASVGSLKATVRPGSIVMVSDHINLSGANPLIGETGDARFTSMTDAYDPKLRYRMKRVAQTAGVLLGEGVYVWFSGPSFETPAEIRMAQVMGGDIVGMSTVPEVILARRFGLRVGALGVVTNLGAGMEGAAPTHDETKRIASTAAIALKRLLTAYFKSFDDA